MANSSVAMLRAIFEAANYKVHTYTSPHLLEFNERIVLAGEKISDEYLFEIMERTRLAAANIRAEQQFFFEGVTVAAFLAFSKIKADILILETGVNGRLDATNIIPSRLLTLITPISYDHELFLGNTLPLIAREKAGIITPVVPSVISTQVDKVYRILIAKCDELCLPAFCYEYDFGIEKVREGFIYSSKNLRQEFPTPTLAGDHQLINAASVIAAITLINNKFNINVSQIIKGLQNTFWPARIQRIDSKRYSHLISVDINIWLDGAHNNGGAKVLSEWVRANLERPIF